LPKKRSRGQVLEVAEAQGSILGAKRVDYGLPKKGEDENFEPAGY
jgi:hypothetical protein